MPSPVSPPVVVVGGGIAGLAAATLLAEAGQKPILLEARSRLGGRASSFWDPESGHHLDNGQHILMGCNHAVQRLLARIGASEGVVWQKRLHLSLHSTSHGRVTIRSLPLPGTTGTLAGLLTTAGLSWTDRLGSVRALRAFLQPLKGLEEISVEDILDKLDIPPLARLFVLEPLALAILNDHPSRASALALGSVVREAFATPGGSALGLPRRSLGQLFAEPASRFIQSLGGRVETGRAVEEIAVGPKGLEGVVLQGGEAWEARAVIVALPPWALGRLLQGLSEFRGLEALATSAVVSAYVWFDRPVMEEPVVGLVGRTAQWAFNRTGLLGLPGPGQAVSITVSAADELFQLSRSAIAETLIEDLRQLLPRARKARVERWVVVKERRATVPLRPGQTRPRPGTRSPIAGLYLAGGWTSPVLPDTLESSARSGEEAARRLLAKEEGA